LGVLILAALLPVWFPWVLKPIARRYGLEFARYERRGYKQFALEGVNGQWPGAGLEAKRVVGVLPATWLWRKNFGKTDTAPFLTIHQAELVIAPPAAEAQPGGAAPQSGSLDKTLRQTLRMAQILEHMLPTAELTNCAIQVVSNRVLLPYVAWRHGGLEAVVKPPTVGGEIHLASQITDNSSLQFQATWNEVGASVRGELHDLAPGWGWKGEAFWQTNRAGLSAQFDTNGWWPVRAQLSCPDLSVPGSLIHLHAYQNVNATLTVTLSSNQFSLQTAGLARPTDDFAVRGVPPVDFSLAADGDSEAVSVRKLRLQSPWLEADLTNSVALTWQGELLASPAQVRLRIDLSKLPGEALTGSVEGVLRVTPQTGRPPLAQFDLAAQDLRAWGVEAASVRGNGEFSSSTLLLNDFEAELVDSSKVKARGAFDFRTRQIAQGEWQCSGGFLKGQLLGLSFDALSGSGKVRGALTNLAHQGRISIMGLREPQLKPLDVETRWSGHNYRLQSAAVELAGGESTLSIEGGADLSGLRELKASAALTNVVLRKDGEALYALAHPCAFFWDASGTKASPRSWKFGVDAFDWQSSNRSASVTATLSWPTSGTVSVGLTNITLADFSDFLTNDLPQVSVASLVAEAHWSNGPIHSAISLVGGLTNRSGESFVLSTAVTTGETMSVNKFALENRYTPTLSVTGNVPCEFFPGSAKGWLAWDKSKAISLVGNWEDPESRKFLLPLGEKQRLEVSKPEMHLRVSGTLENPSASLNVAASRLTYLAGALEVPRPTLENLSLLAELRSDNLRLVSLGAQLDGQPIQASGDWPLSRETWPELWSGRTWPDWNQAHGTMGLDSLAMATLARYLPEVLAPEGQLSANLELKPGKRISGSLSLTNAATRAFGELTPLRDISACVRLAGDRAALESFDGEMGGQPIRAEGFVLLPDLRQYEIHLSGTNVPVARNLELLLRGDFDLRLRGQSNLPPVVSGRVELHDGLYVQHASALVWSKPKRPEFRPPYFSVTNETFADWKLELAVSGGHFLRVRTPVLTGQLSTALKLAGTLREPVLTGDLRMNSGRVVFPFGTLNVDQGLASFSGNDPRGPELQLTATGRNYRYDIRMEIKGPADGAQVVFSSTPPLTSEQTLLMLTAGELPSSEYVFSTAARAGRVATFLGQDLFSRFFGGNQDQQRLILRTGESISEAGRLTYSVEYKLTDRWSIIGEYDEYNAFNADLKWKILAR
jgi:translocation and assembly module TamB